MEDDLVADEKFCEIYKRLPTKFHTSANDVYVTRSVVCKFWRSGLGICLQNIL